LNPAFTTDDVYRFWCDNQHLHGFNKHFSRNEGYVKSLKEDESIGRS